MFRKSLGKQILAREGAEAVLAMEKDSMENLIETATDAIVTVDWTGRILLWNSAAVRMFGYSSEEAIGSRLSNLIIPEESSGRFSEMLSSGAAKDVEMVTLRKDGTRFFGELSFSPPGRTCGRSAGTVILRDISKRKIAQTALEERTRQLEDAIQASEGFSYSVSHDLKAPLRAIDGYARSLLMRYTDRIDPDAERRLLSIRDNARMMGRLIEDLLSFSRLSRKPVKMEKIDLASLANDVWEEIASANPDGRFEFRIGDLLPGLGDPFLVRQVLVNLLSNAAKYAKTRKPAVIEMASREENGQNAYSIRDNGIGFDMRYYDKLFRVFERLHGDEREGTGVGLAIVQRIVQRHGGRVWAEGRVDEGACFYFTLPRP